MEQSANLALPYIMPSQAQKHVTHNEAVRMLDALVQLGVLDHDRATPPGDPAEGDRYIVAAGGIGVWAGKDGDVAAWQDGAWTFLSPRAGWLAWVADEKRLVVFDGVSWTPAVTEIIGAPTFGINAVADHVNRLAVAAPATLLNHEGAGHQLKINKSVSGDTASLLFQTGFSGRAEMGTGGDDDFRVKVSPDGSNWIEAMVIERATGAVRLPGTPGRERLTTPRTYYVRPDGNDGNDGLTNSPGGAFRTIRRTIDAVYGGIDLGPFDVTIQLGDGVYQEQVVLLAPHVGAGTITLAGNAGNPASTVIEGVSPIVPLSIGVVQAANGAAIHLRDLEVRRTGGGLRCLHAENGGVIDISGGNLRFGACNNAHFSAVAGGRIIANYATYALVGNAARHWLAQTGGIIAAFDVSVDVTGRTFSTCFAESDRLGIITARGSLAFTGSATGKRYAATLNGIIDTNTADPNRLPGNEAGSVATGGLYG